MSTHCVGRKSGKSERKWKWVFTFKFNCYEEKKNNRTYKVTEADAVNFAKQKHIIASAENYLDNHKLFDVDYRFDIVEVVGDKNDYEINHIEDAFA